MSINSFQRSLHDAGLEKFSLDIVQRGMQYQCDEHQTTFQLPDGSFAVVAKTDSCRITAGGFADIDSSALIVFANLLITQYRASHPAAPVTHVAVPTIALHAAAAPKGSRFSLDQAAPVAWGAVVRSLPPTGGRGIKNPGCFCYMNAALSALSACPQYNEQVRRLSLTRPEHFVVTRLASVFQSLNECQKPALEHVDTVIERLALSLVSAGCPIEVTDYRKMQDSAELVDFILRAADTQFLLYDPDDYRKVIKASCLLPVLPPKKQDGDDWISLEDCIDRNVTLVHAAPSLLPIWLRRTMYSDEKQWKIDRACRPPLIMQVRIQRDSAIQKVPYYLRAVILHRGGGSASGHYITVVPTTDGMIDDGRFPAIWEVRNDSFPKVEKLSDGFLEDIFHNGVCYLYEKSPFV